jgi:Co/Zn/Cd efflux system component
MRPAGFHTHSHVPPRIVIIAFAITLAAASAEFAGSWYGGSFFLFSDAVHLIAHLGIFAVLLIPAVRARARGGDRQPGRPGRRRADRAVHRRELGPQAARARRGAT